MNSHLHSMFMKQLEMWDAGNMECLDFKTLKPFRIYGTGKIISGDGNLGTYGFWDRRNVETLDYGNIRSWEYRTCGILDSKIYSIDGILGSINMGPGNEGHWEHRTAVM